MNLKANPAARGDRVALARAFGSKGSALLPWALSAWPIWGVLALCALATASLMARAELTINPWNGANVPYYAATIFVLIVNWAPVQQKLPHGRLISQAATHFLMFTAIALMGAIASYPIAAMTGGYADARLQRIDVKLHFDWLAWYRLVIDHRTLQWLGIAAYESIYITPAVLLGWFALESNRAAARRFLATFWLAAVMTLGIFCLMPAAGPLAYLWHGPIPYMPRSELWQPNLIPLLRAHSVHVIDLGQLRGLVSAPSFHAAAATLYIIAALRIPNLRWALVSLNGAMLLSTPVEGTHYLTDVILGIVVALMAILLVGAATQTSQNAGRPSFGSRLKLGRKQGAAL